MLVLSRQLEESVVIGGNIRIRVLEFRQRNGRMKVRLGIDAPRHVSIHREEVQLRVDGEIAALPREVALQELPGLQAGG